MNIFFRANASSKRRSATKTLWSPQKRYVQGFTLLEMLIAMTLTAVIGTVLFSTYNMVMDSGIRIRKTVSQREGRRIFWTILDSDLSGLCLMENVLPPLSRVPISNSEAYLRWSGDEKVTVKDSEDEIILSFATTTSLTESLQTSGSGPVCVEYRLCSGNNAKVLVRRERAFCGVDGDFPWEEYVLLRNIRKIDVALYNRAQNQFETEWEPVQAGDVPESIRFTVHWELTNSAEESQLVVPLFPRRTALAY